MAIPLVLTIADWGEDPRLRPTLRIYHWWLAVGALIPVFRLFAWYVLRRGPSVIDSLAAQMQANQSPAKRRALEWTFFWSGAVSFCTIAILVLIPAFAVAFSEKSKPDPPLTGAVIRQIYGTATTIENNRFRVTGAVRGPLREWPADATRKYDSAGLVIAMLDGAEVAAFADAHELRKLRKSFAAQRDGVFTCTVRTHDEGGRSISDHYRRLYAWDENDLEPIPEEAKPFTPTGRRMLVDYVDP